MHLLLSHIKATSATWQTNISVSEVFRDPGKILVKQVVCLPFSLAETIADKILIPPVNFLDKNPVKWSESSIGRDKAGRCHPSFEMYKQDNFISCSVERSII
jgi:hypothetical protein